MILNFPSVLLAIVTVVLVVLAVGVSRDPCDSHPFIVAFFLLVAVWAGYGSYRCGQPETVAAWAEEDRLKEEQDKRNRLPHVVREADGCKVYAFLSGDRYHYFTRCSNDRVTTESSYEECTGSGKSRHCENKTESITTN